MTADDQHFLDILAGVSSDIRKFSADVADATDRHFESVALSIREALASATWLPQSARPSRPPPPPVKVSPPTGYLALAQDWVSRNRAITAAIVAFVGTGAFLIYRKRRGYARKRRARRASNGARREVVVIAGPPSSPIIKSLALDLERRGFIVYIVVNSSEEEQTVQAESRVDIRPLHLDIVDTFATQAAMERFNSILLYPHHAFSGASPHNLNFAGIILVPDLLYPTGPIETVTPDLWSDALNVKVLGTIATAQAFLPTVCEFKAKVLMLTPSIVSSLRPPFHGVESAVVGALEGFTSSLRQELDTLGISVCHFKLGTFDCGAVGGKSHLATIGDPQTDSWPPSARAQYAQNFVMQSRIAGSRGLFSGSGAVAKGSSLRELHNAVFDALTQKRPRKVWRVGRGSVAYDIVGNWVPAGIVGWMMGVRRVSLDEVSEPKLEDSVGTWERVEKAV
ncbi:hypothetical protein H2201_000897 [Coniosporium apollinis]|uniref:DUF1776-domain-containing protein n=1 Tax=Coniosporium apollinis TaxID=61459 RepID=A0ABQ9P512_9PEZI|nr:hypothetical protein H2201_000897 [Coniosporium apollinis]